MYVCISADQCNAIYRDEIKTPKLERFCVQVANKAVLSACPTLHLFSAESERLRRKDTSPISAITGIDNVRPKPSPSGERVYTGMPRAPVESGSTTTNKTADGEPARGYTRSAGTRNAKPFPP